MDRVPSTHRSVVSGISRWRRLCLVKSHCLLLSAAHRAAVIGNADEEELKAQFSALAQRHQGLQR